MGSTTQGQERLRTRRGLPAGSNNPSAEHDDGERIRQVPRSSRKWRRGRWPQRSGWLQPNYALHGSFPTNCGSSAYWRRSRTRTGLYWWIATDHDRAQRAVGSDSQSSGAERPSVALLASPVCSSTGRSVRETGKTTPRRMTVSRRGSTVEEGPVLRNVSRSAPVGVGDFSSCGAPQPGNPSRRFPQSSSPGATPNSPAATQRPSGGTVRKHFVGFTSKRPSISSQMWQPWYGHGQRHSHTHDDRVRQPPDP